MAFLGIPFGGPLAGAGAAPGIRMAWAIIIPFETGVDQGKFFKWVGARRGVRAAGETRRSG